VIVTGAFVDRALVPGAAEAIAAALDRYGALVFPGVDLADQVYIDFGHELGELVVLPRGQIPGFPEIEAISRDPDESPELAKYREGAFLWHIDGTTTPNPHRATILSCRRIAVGDEGDTELANTYAAYDALSDADKALIDGLQVQHTFAAAQRKAFPNASEKVQASWNDAPSRVHLLAVERYDGRKWLMVGATADHVIDMIRRRVGRRSAGSTRVTSPSSCYATADAGRSGDVRQPGRAAPPCSLSESPRLMH
jgi:alpha-ketoglutarate-dependent taurine dioxygenase